MCLQCVCVCVCVWEIERERECAAKCTNFGMHLWKVSSYALSTVCLPTCELTFTSMSLASSSLCVSSICSPYMRFASQVPTAYYRIKYLYPLTPPCTLVLPQNRPSLLSPVPVESLSRNAGCGSGGREGCPLNTWLTVRAPTPQAVCWLVLE